MEPTEKARFDILYQHHLWALELRGMSDSTIDVYSAPGPTKKLLN